MAAKSKKPKKLAPYLSDNVAVEDRTAVAVTVAWILATIGSLSAQILGAGAYVLLQQADLPTRQSTLGLLPALMWLIAVVTGVIALALLPVVYRMRKVLPPRSIAAGAFVVGLTPLVVALVRWIAAATGRS